MRALFIFISFLAIACSNETEIKPTYNPALGSISATNAISDIEYLFKRLETVHYNPYLHVSKENISNEIKSLENKWNVKDTLRNAEFIIETMKLLSKVEDGHTKMVWYSTELLSQRDSINYFPLGIKYEKDKGLLINDTSFIKYQGNKVLSINGLDAQELYLEALACLSGNFEYKNEIASNLFFPVFLYLKDLNPPYSLTLESNQKIEINKSMTASFMDLYSRLQPSTSNYEFNINEQNNIGILSYNSCTDYEAFKLFLAETFKKIEQQKIKDLIIDIRYNSGGDSALNDLLLAYITSQKYRQSSKRIWKLSEVSLKELDSRGVKDYYGEDYLTKYRLKSDTTKIVFGEDEPSKAPAKPEHYFKGQCYLLIGPKTFSSANMLADAVSTYKLFPLIGMPTGERTNDFGEQKTELLPHSNFPFDYTIAFDIGANGDESIVKTVVPDIKVEGNALDYTINHILKTKGNLEK